MQPQIKMDKRDCLSDRSREILRAIIQLYIETAEPVGSRTLSKMMPFNLSAATIRNAMSDLEELGYLTQPHTSAGRLPTEAGLRYFVEHLIETRELSLEDQEAIEKALLLRCEDLASTLKKSVEILATFTGHAAVASSPKGGRTSPKHVEFIRIRPSLVLVVTVSETGFVENRTVRLPWDISEDRLERLSHQLNAALSQMDLEEVRESLSRDLENDKRVISSLLDIAHPHNLSALDTQDVFVSGRPNLLDQPEFFRNQGLRGLLQALEEKQNLIILLDRYLEKEDVQIIIGPEELGHDVPRCSMVLAPYDKKDTRLGGIGVIGPVRMDYPRVIAFVEYTRNVLRKKLQEFCP